MGSTGAVTPLLAADICSDEICHQRQTFPESPIFSVSNTDKTLFDFHVAF